MLRSGHSPKPRVKPTAPTKELDVPGGAAGASKNGLLHASKGVSEAGRGDWVQSLHGLSRQSLNLQMWSVRRLPPCLLSRVGDTLLPRNKNARGQLLRHSDVLNTKPPRKPDANKKRTVPVHATASPFARLWNTLLRMWGIRRRARPSPLPRDPLQLETKRPSSSRPKQIRSMDTHLTPTR